MAAKNGVVNPHEVDPHFLGRGIDADELHELRERARCGCPLCVTSDPWSEFKYGTDVRLDDGVIGEGELLIPQRDFRDDLDEEHVSFEDCGGEIVVRHCSAELAMSIQEIGCSAVVAMGKGLYDLFFPIECRDDLQLQAGILEAA